MSSRRRTLAPHRLLHAKGHRRPNQECQVQTGVPQSAMSRRVRLPPDSKSASDRRGAASAAALQALGGTVGEGAGGRLGSEPVASQASTGCAFKAAARPCHPPFGWLPAAACPLSRPPPPPPMLVLSLQSSYLQRSQHVEGRPALLAFQPACHSAGSSAADADDDAAAEARGRPCGRGASQGRRWGPG